VVKVLLKPDVARPNKPHSDVQASRWAAAWKGHLGVVNILLAWEEANPAKPQ